MGFSLTFWMKIFVSQVNWKKIAQSGEFWVVLFGQNEDYRPGDSLSDSWGLTWETEEGRPGEGVRVSMHVILVKRECTQSSMYFFQKVSTSLMKITASHQEQMTTWRVLILL